MLKTIFLWMFAFKTSLVFSESVNFTKVENAENIYVGTIFIQKISSFFINDSDISCTEQFLPILFRILNDKKVDEEVDGFLNEKGNVVNNQQIVNCRLFKK